MKQKCQLYFEAGPKEVWVWDPEGNVRFFDPNGERETSLRVRDFPIQVEI